MSLSRRLGVLTLGAVLVGASASAAGGARVIEVQLTATAARLRRLDLQCRQVDSAALRQDGSVAPRAQRLDARQRDDQVRLRRDRVVQGRRRRPRRDEPAVTGKTLKAQPGRRHRLRAAHGQACADTITAAVEKAVPTAKIGTAFQTAYGGVAAQVPANSDRRSAHGLRRRRGAEGHAEPAARRQHVVHRRDERLAVARRVGDMPART